ncbi:hypothetical protein AK830_g8700 [Neonectria ditissima]|uniref:NACHT domain-containing protein n=1 Tax=Neonectria ditissima TaxID=78410 RepID=A0A0P7BDQ5_9HYPO|nr:hypothetical protein AK830_g8700 [Neonectria ditissima]
MESIALAGNVIQFVELTTKLAVSCYRYWLNPEESLKEDNELKLATTSLQSILARLSVGKQSKSDPDLVTLIRGCSSLNQELLDLLERVRGRAGKGKMDRLLQSAILSAKRAVKKKEITDLEERIVRLRDAVFIRLKVHLGVQYQDLDHDLVEHYKAPSIRGSALEKFTLEFRRKALRREILSIIEKIGEERVNWNFTEQDLYRIGNLLPELGQTLHDFDRARAIVRSLYFQQLRDRESEIPAAYEATFQWVFDRDTTVNLADWLRGEPGVYWITGKAGSGKSTMMKFLTQHPRTRSLLRNWGGDDVIIAKHFFWGAGTSLQMSQEGLLRTLLFEILVNLPDICALVCPRRWADDSFHDLDSWTLEELAECLSNLRALRTRTSTEIAARANRSVSVCLFVDGFDEFSGDHDYLAKFVQDLGESHNIKICASSRPWLDFLDAFGHNHWQLKMHELTGNDISTFTTGMLLKNSHFQAFEKVNPNNAAFLVAQICDRAQGVFLWVFLVVRSLLRGLRNEDDISILNLRMAELPDELDVFFGRMLEGIERVYRKHAARTLQLIALAYGPIPLFTFLFLDPEDCKVNSDPVITLDSWPRLDEKGKERVRVEKRRLMAQCKDLLHISQNIDEPVPLGEKVGPLHRTVLDFLRSQDIRLLLDQQAGLGFDPHNILLCAYVHQFQSLVHMCHLTILKPHLRHWMDDIFRYAGDIEVMTGHAAVETLDKFENCLMNLFKKHRYSFQDGMKGHFDMSEGTQSFLHMAAWRGLRIYTQIKGFQPPEAEADTHESIEDDEDSAESDDVYQVVPHRKRGSVWNKIRVSFGL